MLKQNILLVLFFISISTFSQINESKAIDSIFTEWNKNDSPGCSLGIIKDNVLVYAKGYGLANMEYNIPNSASSVFRIGSTSKQFTAACIVLLAEQKKLNLNDNLKSLFPDFPSYAESITIKHLLNHTSGIRDYLQVAYLKGLGDDDYYVDAEIMKWLINQSDLNFTPGEEYLYSNSGYWLLGQIVNKVSGMNMAEFAQKEIFEPLGMNNTHFHNDHTAIVNNRASGYVPSDNDNYKISMTTLDMIGDGGIFTSINDIKKWDDAYYDNSVLSEEFWSMMTQQGVLNNGEEISYASGLMVGIYKGLKTVRHGGAFVGFRAELLRFPDQKLSIAIFANRGDANPSGKANQVADILLKDKLIQKVDKKENLAKTEQPLEVFALSQLTGDYEIQAGVVASLTIKNDSLNVLQKWNQSSYNIVKVDGNTFKIPETENLSFTFSELKNDNTQLMTVFQNGSEMKAKRIKEFDTAKINLNDYVGSYYSPELDVTYNFSLKEEKLMLSIEDGQNNMECSISEIDQLSSQFGLARFQRKNNVISGFELDSGRVKNLKFERE